MRLLLLALIAALSIFLVSHEAFYGMSPGTLTQLSSTSVKPLKGPYLIY